jgi:RNA binding exosome subunit
MLKTAKFTIAVPFLSSKPVKYPIGYVNIRVFVHATEEQERVFQAVRNTLPVELGEGLVFKKTECTGHHGNPITLVEVELADRQSLMGVFQKIGQSLTSLDKEALNTEFEQHLEKGNLYLRFDKQEAFLGEFRFSSVDPIHFKIHFRNKTAEEIFAICKDAGLLP